MIYEVFDRQMKEISEIARKQLDGPYAVESDARISLVLIEKLALLLAEAQDTRNKGIGGQ